MRATPTLTTLLLLLAGCNQPPAVESDAGRIEVPDAGAPACAPPPEPYGTSLNSNFRPLNLPRCDGTPFEFYGEEEGFCDARFTVLTMAAGWCQPCRLEAEQMRERLVEVYEPEGVRFVVAVIQDNDYRRPDAAFCQSWVDEHGLTNPVLLDANQETQIYFPAGSLPANLIVDSRGVIVHREYGASVGLETIRAKLEQLLAQ